jgi:hypothetical protein
MGGLRPHFRKGCGHEFGVFLSDDMHLVSISSFAVQPGPLDWPYGDGPRITIGSDTSLFGLFSYKI